MIAVIESHACQSGLLGRNRFGERSFDYGRNAIMAVKELVKDESVLSQVCEAAEPEDAATAQDLIDTMASLDDAACLHANQIGVTKSLFAYVDDRDNVHVMYNPAIKLGLAASKQVEGCFTRDDVTTVTRYDRIKVVFQELVDGQLVSRKRDFQGWQAQLVQHMVDHSKGKLI